MLKDDGIHLLICLLAGIFWGAAALKHDNIYYAFMSGWFLCYVVATLIHNSKTVKE